MKTVITWAVVVLVMALFLAVAIVPLWLLVRFFVPGLLYWHAVVFMWLFTILVAAIHYGRRRH